MKILVAEDDQNLLQILKDTLKSAGHEVISVESVIAGVRIVNEQGADLDLVITDVQMPIHPDSIFPDGSGLEIARMIYSTCGNTKEQPFVYIHSSSQSDHGTSLVEWVKNKPRTTFQQKSSNRQQTASNVLAFTKALI